MSASLSIPELTVAEAHEVSRLRTWIVNCRDMITVFRSIHAIIQREKGTGQLRINYSQGSVNSLQFHEAQRMTVLPRSNPTRPSR